MGQAVVELEVCGVLAEVGKLCGLEAIILVEELEVQGSPVRNVGIICVKRHLRKQLPGGSDADQR
jgi:hypothetical protein